MRPHEAARPLSLLLAVAMSGLIWGIWWLPLRQLESAGLAGNWANLAVYALLLVQAPAFSSTTA